MTVRARSSHSALICRQFWHPGKCPSRVSLWILLQSPLWTSRWLHHRLRSCWKFPKLLFPLCRLCDLHFPGLSVRFVTGYLLPPRMTNLLLRVLVGGTTGSAKGGRTRSCGTRQMKRVWTPTGVCFRCILQTTPKKPHIIYYREEAIITGDTHTKVPPRASVISLPLVGAPFRIGSS